METTEKYIHKKSFVFCNNHLAKRGTIFLSYFFSLCQLFFIWMINAYKKFLILLIDSIENQFSKNKIFILPKEFSFIKPGYVLILPLLLFFSCEEEAIKQYPVVEVLSVNSISPDSLQLMGNVKDFGVMGIEDHGFLIGPYDNRQIFRFFKLSLGEISGSGKFSAIIPPIFDVGQKINIKSFLTVGTETVMPLESLEFNGSGVDLNMYIDSISPLSGTSGDTITIYSHRELVIDFIEAVKLDSMNCAIIERSDLTLKFLVDDYSSGNIDLSITFFQKDIPYDKPFYFHSNNREEDIQ
ncbi:MAG: hypothetical protein ACLFQS_08105 [Bacteroidales bacterium]